MENALQGIRILDLTRVLAGPYCSMILADMGAEVIKIEVPGRGDDSRHFGPHVQGESAYFMSLNRNKKSITLNLKQEAARDIFLSLVETADVVLENYRPGTMEKLGLGYDVLRRTNPRVIYAAVSGFGHSGPYRSRPAYDGVVQAMGGIMSITGQRGGKPTRVGPSIGDITAGMYTAIGILAALNYRQHSGCGQMVDVAMLDCQVSILENAIARYFASGTSPVPVGNRHASIVPFEPFDTADGEIMVAAGNDTLWRTLCEQLQLAELADDSRFATNPLRNDHYEELRPLLAARFILKTTDTWQEILDAAGVPNGPINNIERLARDPQVKAREMLVAVDHPVAGEMTCPGVPIKMSLTPGAIRAPAPLLGQHTEEILKSLGRLDDETIDRLRAGGAI